MDLRPTWYPLPPDSTDRLIYIARHVVYADGFHVRLTFQQYDTLLDNWELLRTEVISQASLDGYP